MDDNDLQIRYREAIALVVRVDVVRATGRARSTLDAYVAGTRRVTTAAARELVKYLRGRSAALSTAADRVEAALLEEESGGK